MADPEFVNWALGDEEMAALICDGINEVKLDPDIDTEGLDDQHLAFAAFAVAVKETGRSYGVSGNKALIDTAIRLTRQQPDEDI
jgi:hypothetical protein